MEYMPSVISQAVCFVYSAGLGFCLGLVYDFFRILFILFTGNDKKLSTIRDIIYMLFCLGVHFVFILVMCSGQIMLFTFTGEIIGLTAYFKTLSRQIVSPLKGVILCLRRTTEKFFMLLKAAARKISEFSQNARKKVKKSEKIFQKDLQIRHNILYNLSVILCSDRANRKNRGDEHGKKENA